jgi:regulatory protein
VKVEKLTKSQHMADRWYLVLSNGESVKADLNMIADLSLYEGRELTDEELSELLERASLFGAKERAYGMLSTRQMSRKELTEKLTKKGETAEDAEAVSELMERIGAINDSEYARTIVRHYAKKGYGEGRIKNELSRRGIPKELWEEALSEKPESDDTLDRLIASRLKGETPDKKELKKLTDMLLRRGFSWSEIKSALGRYDELLEETE